MESGQRLTKLLQLQLLRGLNASASKISEMFLNCQMIGKIYNRKINTPVGKGRGRDGVGVVPRVTDNLESVNTRCPGATGRLLTSIAVTKNKIFVIGGPGQ